MNKKILLQLIIASLQFVIGAFALVLVRVDFDFQRIDWLFFIKLLPFAFCVASAVYFMKKQGQK